MQYILAPIFTRQFSLIIWEKAKKVSWLNTGEFAFLCDSYGYRVNVIFLKTNCSPTFQWSVTSLVHVLAFIKIA